MIPTDRTRLTSELRAHVAKIAADLRTKMRAQGPARVRAEQLHKDERVAEDFEVWTDLLSRRAAVLWVLKSVYLRVLEDRGLLSPGRLLDPEAQQLFERLAPNLGETAFLRWVYRDLASADGGLPELFSPQPAEVALPSDELSRALIAFWRHRDADTGAVWSFAEERFEGELMGDLYQELDPVVKDRFALCQTPDFVREFILDRTLTPAIETFKADQVRLLDPACGSGHFLIDGLKRLVAATTEQHPEWERGKVVTHALDRVVGIDLNDYACALARTRLLMTAAELAGVTSLASAARFHPHVYWADGLEQVERDDVNVPVQTSLFDTGEKPRATLTRSDVRAALKKVFAKKFHAVVANPPYITEKDAGRKEYHREKIGKQQRYVSAYREYSLASPFTERCFQLAEKEGFVGLITSNNFMKREFGKPLIEKVLAALDLTLVVDTSQTYIPFHGTPTVLLFARNRAASTEHNTVRAVMGKRGEAGTPEDPARGRVWSSIAEGWYQAGFQNEYISVAELPRETLDKHPWSLGGGGAAELKLLLETTNPTQLRTLVQSIGLMCITKQDKVFVQDKATLDRLGCEPDWQRAFPMGEEIRDWAVTDSLSAIFPYDPSVRVRPLSEAPRCERFMWRFRRILEERAVFGGDTFRTSRREWWSYGQIPENKFAPPCSIAFSKIATHNHFAFDRGNCLFSDGTPVIKLAVDSSEDDHFALLGLLNSSVACFWMKQVFHNKGGGTDAGKMQSDLAKIAHEFTATGLEVLPVPRLESVRPRMIRLTRALNDAARERINLLPNALPEIDQLTPESVDEMKERLKTAEENAEAALQRQIVLQEELDWLAYRAYGLVSDSGGELFLSDAFLNHALIPIGARPFEISQAKSGRQGGVDGQQLYKELPEGTPPEVTRVWEARVRAIASSPEVSLIEHERYKRRWLLTPKHLAGSVETFADQLRERITRLLADVVEATARTYSAPFDIARLSTRLQSDARFELLAELSAGKRDFSPERLVLEVVTNESVPNHPSHRYSSAGMIKHTAWETTWEFQRREDAGEKVVPPLPPTYAQPDFVSRRVFELRGKLDVPKERFIAFTEVPGRAGAETLYGWAGWTPSQRLKAILAMDEDLEDAGIPLADRIGLLDSAWRLLPDVAREDPTAAPRLKAELQALVGPDGPSRELVEDWKKRFPPPTARAKAKRATPAKRTKDTTESEESDAS